MCVTVIPSVHQSSFNTNPLETRSECMPRGAHWPRQGFYRLQQRRSDMSGKQYMTWREVLRENQQVELLLKGALRLPTTISYC